MPLLTLMIVIVAIFAIGFEIRNDRIANQNQQSLQQKKQSEYVKAIEKEKKEKEAQQKFIVKLSKPAIKSYNKNKEVLPSIVIAQAVLESDWGTSGLYLNANNPFGIKGDYNGESIRYKTAEYVKGKRVYEVANFRKYPDLQAAIDDHNYLISKRFIKRTDLYSFRKQANLIQKNAYATDPDYAKKVIGVIVKNNLRKYDTQAINSYEE